MVKSHQSETHTPFPSAYKTRMKHGRRSETHTLHTPSAYKTRMKHGCRSETHTPHTITQSPVRETVTPYTLCLQGPHETWSPVSHTHPTLSAYKEPYKA